MRSLPAVLLAVGSTTLLALAAPSRAAAPHATGAGLVPGVPLQATRTAVVQMADLARRERLALPASLMPDRFIAREKDEGPHNEYGEPGAGITGLDLYGTPPPLQLDVASPSPSSSYVGLDDVPMADSLYIVIPPDVGGAVGPTRIFQGQNNNYRILDKATGAVISTVGTATFWAPVIAVNERLSLTDPRTLYDPYNDRWIAHMQTVTSGAGKLLIAISQTSDPAGAWYLYAFNTGATIDFPTVGFNKNWIAVAINRYSGVFQRGITLVVDYPSARAGTGSAVLFNQAANTHFCSAPCVTYSPSEETLYVVTHLGSAGATYTFDTITGTPGSPAYTAGGALVRPGGGWSQPGGNILPQSAPVSGTSACAGAPCPIESQDSQVRSAPVFRDGFVWYAQTVGLPAGGLTHTGVQWTKLNTPAGTVAEGGRIDDATATSVNGGKWYAFPHLAVNANHDVILGYSQFSSAQHPAAGYSMHLAGDAAGSMRDPLIYKAGEDYYHKTFSTATGRNRWGDFSQAQVDPDDDMTLWVVQEYAKARVNTDDGNTGANGSRWSSWWAAVAPPAVSVDAGPTQSEGNAGTTAFDFTVRLSYAYGLPVTVEYTTSDGSATSADNDYTPETSSVIVPAGSLTATISIDVLGDPSCEGDQTFDVTLTGDNRNLPITTAAATGTITNDDTDATIDATAGTGGAISPSGPVVVACGEDQSFDITPDPGYTTQQILVDGSPVAIAPSYTFTDVQGPHTIEATFSSTTSVGDAGVALGLGAVVPNPAHGEMQVAFGLPGRERVRVAVIDLQGREVAVLAEGEHGPGLHSARWRGGAAGAGIYFVRYEAAGRTFMRKFALMR